MLSSICSPIDFPSDHKISAKIRFCLYKKQLSTSSKRDEMLISDFGQKLKLRNFDSLTCIFMERNHVTRHIQHMHIHLHLYDITRFYPCKKFSILCFRRRIAGTLQMYPSFETHLSGCVTVTIMRPTVIVTDAIKGEKKKKTVFCSLSSLFSRKFQCEFQNRRCHHRRRRNKHIILLLRYPSLMWSES